MANPRQRRKARSSSYRPVSHAKHAKRNLKKTPPICGPKALQEAWDKKKTVRQNYARLGLAASLDPLTHGGIEQPLGPLADLLQPATTSASPSVDPSKADVPSGFGRIIRNAAGGVVGVELNEAEPQAIEVEDIDGVGSRIDPEVRRQWAGGSTKGDIGIVSNNAIINELERMSASMSASSSGVGARHVSGGQMKFLDALVKRHGGDIKAMAADLKLNPEQRTTGQIRRALKSASLLTPQLDFTPID